MKSDEEAKDNADNVTQKNDCIKKKRRWQVQYVAATRLAKIIKMFYIDSKHRKLKPYSVINTHKKRYIFFIIYA